MSRSWNNFILVVLLTLLQGFAPLLHAHVLEFSMPHKIPIDGLEVDLAYNQPDAGVHLLHLHTDDSIAIGMESASRNDRDDKNEILVSAPILDVVTAPFILPHASAPPLPAHHQTIWPPPSRFYFLPPPQAPPGANLG